MAAVLEHAADVSVASVAAATSSSFSATVVRRSPDEKTKAAERSRSRTSDADTDGEGQHRIVTATTRTIDDLDVPVWLAFTMCACLARTILQYPFVLAMTRRQACARAETLSSSALLRDLYREAGSARAWFRGLPAYATGLTLSEVVYMAMLEWLRNPAGPVARAAGNPSTAALDGGAGLAADFTTSTGNVPFVLIANRQMCAGIGELRNSPYESAAATFRRLVAGGGYRAAFSGLSATILLATHSGFWWAAYGELKAAMYRAAEPATMRLQRTFPNAPTVLTSSTDNFVINSAAAVVAGTTVAVLWNPAVVVRTRMQVGAGSMPAASAPRMRDVVKDLWRREGLRGFMRGTNMAMVSTAVDVVAFSVLYEGGRLLAQKY